MTAGNEVSAETNGETSPRSPPPDRSDGTGPDPPDADAGDGGGWTAPARVMIHVEDLIYVAVAVVLVVLAAAVLGAGGVEFVGAATGGELRDGALVLLDSVLLVLMIVELLHTVGISIRKNILVPEPFLIVGLIAAVRRVLILTAEQGSPSGADAAGFRLAMLELGLLTLLIVGLVAGIIALSRWRRSEELIP